MFTKSIHKVVFFFRITTSIKKEKKRKMYSFSLFHSTYLFFWGRQNEQLHRIPLSRLIHSSSNSNNVFDLFVVFKRYQVIAHSGHCVDERKSNGPNNNNYANGSTISWSHSLFSKYSYMVESALKQDVKTQ